MRIGVGLSIPELATRGGRFSPASLFTAGTVGAWYDPSDYSTLFQDSAGTTPVTAVEQPVGLMLDKSQGLVLGSDVVVNGDFATDTNWTKGAGWTISGGSANLVAGGYPIISQNFSYTLGAWYQVTFTVTNRVSAIVQFLTSPGRQKGPQTSANGTYTFLFLASAGDTYIGIQDQNGVGSLSIDNLIVKQLSGNHASQATAASRPVLRARYNQLTYSEQFDNAAWGARPGMLAFGSGSVANATAAPDGTTTADLLVPNTVAAAEHYADVAAIAFVSGASYTISVYAKAFGYKWLRLAFNSSVMPASERAAWFDVEAGTVGTVQTNVTANIVSVGNGWYRCSISRSATSSATPAQSGFIQITNADGGVGFTANGTSGMYWWGADLRTGSSAGTYQRIAAATDYATAGFLPYLYFVTDDSFGTNSINFSATDKMFVCAGLTKLSDAATSIFAELSATVSGNAGSFYVAAPEAKYSLTGRGTVGPAVNQRADATSTTYNAPSTVVLSGLMNISGDSNELRLNATSINTATGDQGAGNYGNYPLFIGRRNNASLPFEGRIYGLIVCGKALSASELSATESWMNSRTGAY